MNDIITPQFEVDLPYINKTVLVRPFLVKEEKLLLLAASSNDENEIIQTTLQVVQNCILDDTKVDKLPFFLVDYLFITLRAKSVGDKVKINFRCENTLVDGNKCHTIFESDLDILDAKFKQEYDSPSDITLSKEAGARMRWPTYAELKRIPENLDDFEQKFQLLQCCIDMTYTKDTVVSRKDSADNFRSFLENLTEGQYRKLFQWIKAFPTFYIEVEEDCPKCGFKHKVQYREFGSFF